MYADTVEEFFGVDEFAKFSIVPLDDFHQTLSKLVKNDPTKRIFWESFNFRVGQLKEGIAKWISKRRSEKNCVIERVFSTLKNSENEKNFKFGITINVPFDKINENIHWSFQLKPYLDEEKGLMREIVVTEMLLNESIAKLYKENPKIRDEMQTLPFLFSKRFV